MNKQDIEDWLYKNNMEDTAYVFTCKPYEEGAESLSKIILDCFNELAPKWVNVEDGLPEDGEEILMFMGDGAVMSDLRHHTGRFSAKYGFERSRVTNWMPLDALLTVNKLEGGE